MNGSHFLLLTSFYPNSWSENPQFSLDLPNSCQQCIPFLHLVIHKTFVFSVDCTLVFLGRGFVTCFVLVY